MPQNVYVLSFPQETPCFDSPKSVILMCPSRSRMMFSGLRSLQRALGSERRQHPPVDDLVLVEALERGDELRGVEARAVLGEAQLLAQVVEELACRGEIKLAHARGSGEYRRSGSPR